MSDCDNVADVTARPFFKQCTRCGGLGYIRYGATRNKCTECDGRGTPPRIRWGQPGDGEGK